MRYFTKKSNFNLICKKTKMGSQNIKIILLLLLFVSCRDKKGQTNEENVIKKKVEKTSNHNTKIVQNENHVIDKSKDLIKTLLPTSYRIFNNEDPTKELGSDWFDLSEKNGKYYLEKAIYKLTKGYDECVGVEIKTITTGRKTLLLIEDPKLSIGEVPFLPIIKKYTWPKQQQSFFFKNQTYTLRAEGTTEENLTPENDDDNETLWGKVKNYKIYLSKNGNSETLLLSEEDFNDTFVELLFVGDIDRDGKLDFIFGANRDYEETRVILFLSSEAEVNKIIRKVSEIAIQFDC